MKQYKQCLLMKESGATQVSWIELRGAKPDHLVEIPPKSKIFWRVEHVYNDVILDEPALKQLQKNAREGFASTEKTTKVEKHLSK